MHVAFTTDDEGARADIRWVLHHLLTCRGWFLQDEDTVPGARVTIHYGNGKVPGTEAPGLILQVDRLASSADAHPSTPEIARASDGRELQVAYPGNADANPTGETLWVREDGSPLATLIDDAGALGRTIVRLRADVLHPASFLMTRAEERHGQRDPLDRFDPADSWLKKCGLLARPVVDEIGWLLDDLLLTLHERAGAWCVRRAAWPGARSHAIAITHDQDQSIRWERRLARHALGMVKGPDRAGQAALFVRDIRAGAVPETLLTERLMRWERERDVEATYFFLMVRRDRFGRRYDVSSPSFRKVIARLREEGHTVGLHGSLRTYQDPELFMNERTRIGKVLGKPPSGVRQHYLRIQLPDTWKHQQEAGFRYDASLGYPDEPGFRAGTSFPFFPQSLPSFLAFPLSGMDRALHANGLTTPDAWRDWAAPARQVSGLVDVLWHPYFIDSDSGPDRESATIAMLDWASSSGAWVAGLDRVDAWWRARAAFDLVDTGSASGEERATFQAGAAVQDLALTLEAADSDIRIAEADRIEARWVGDRIMINADAGGTMTLSRRAR